MRILRISFILSLSTFFLTCFPPSSRAQTNAELTGHVTDPKNASVAGAQVEAINVDTNVVYPSETNGDGLYRIPNVPPGRYRIRVEKTGFSQIVKPDVEVHIEDILTINFSLRLGSLSETVTVEGGAPLLNTTDASVSTVVDHNFVENMPLNGRSLQDLILLTPGVVTSSPQGTGDGGEFQVNGQRDTTNYYTVDGVSANVGAPPRNDPTSPGLSGSLPGATALGTTQALVSVDALQEFRVQTSTYSAEYGRNPGGQFSFVTRSGTNQWHGSAYDYIRNNTFDSNDWFNNYNNVKQAPLRQNDFGGTLGGPARLPRIYNGKDKTFFFFSYEGLRLLQPAAATPSFVPDAFLRQSAPAAIQPILNAFPMSNCTNPATCITHGDLAEFIGSWSNPSSIDSYSARLDHAINDRMKLFFRFGDTHSSAANRNLSVVNSATYDTRSYTFGTTTVISPRLSNEFRLNYSVNKIRSADDLDSFGGAVPIDLFALQGLSGGGTHEISVGLSYLGSTANLTEFALHTEQEQWNITDAIALSIGRNQLKFGIDYRHLQPQIIPYSPFIRYNYSSEAKVLSNTASGSGSSYRDVKPYYQNFSAFLQDELRLAPRLSLSMGVRWEVNPAPGASDGNPPYTVRGSSLATLVLAPKGTPLWDTTWFNFAPRLGVAYVLRDSPRWETVVRGGGGVFFDSGQQDGSFGYSGLGASAFSGGLSGAFPFSLATSVPVIPTQFTPPYGFTSVFPQHLQLPYTLQWNAAIQQALGQSQALTLSYVGAHASRLLEANQVALGPGSVNPNFTSLNFYQNGLTSDYDALQVQFQRRLSYGIQALASYTLGHSIDYASSNATLPYVRGNSDFDVRHNFSLAVSYDLPGGYKNAFTRAILGHWSIDDRFSARSGFPVPLQGNLLTDPATGGFYNGELNIVPGQPFYLYGANCASVFQAIGAIGPGQGCPGGRAVNPNAFILPTDPSDPGNAPRNFIRGFGAWQMDLAVRREFPISERLKLQFRAEAFNIFNHPNFGQIDNFYGDPLFGQPLATLGQSLTGLSPLYQTGSARSMQFAAKLFF